ncbi:MAG: cytochrome c3 family protein [Nitrospirales bacterium]|nr:cytochrome c3 family protein [Nitrospirales bacterium]
MKKVVIAAVATLLVAGTAFATTIVNSKHDMRGSQGRVGNATSTQVCVYCHAPHGGSTEAPLWNHSMSTATYQLYASSTIQGSASQPSGVSKACLSCHDGTVAVNSVAVMPRDGNLGSAAKSPFTNLKLDTANDGTIYLGTDLRNDHPVSITYRQDLDNTLRANTNAAVVNGAITLPLFGTATPYTVECGSCHNVHDPANTPFLRAANSNSQLCLTCHLK